MQKDCPTLDIKTGRLFPLPFLLVAAIFVLAAIGLFGSYPLASVVLLLLSTLIFTAHAGVELDRVQQTYREYNSFLFIRNGKARPYRDVEKIFINDGLQSQRVYTTHTTTSSVFTNSVYRAYIKFDDGEKVLLGKESKKEKLQPKAQQVADYLQTSLIDHSY